MASRLAFLWNDQGWPFRDLWLVQADGRGRAPPDLAAAGRSRAGAARGRGHRGAGGRGRRARAWRHQRSAVGWRRRACSSWHRGRLFRLALGAASAAPEPLEAAARRVGRGALARPHAALAFLRDGDLWLWTRGTAAAERLTAIGRAGDWQDGGRHLQPRRSRGGHRHLGRRLAAVCVVARWRCAIVFHAVDRRHIRRVPFPSYLGDRKRSRASSAAAIPGDENERRTLHVVTVATRAIADLAVPEPGRRAVSDYAWSPSGRLLVDHVSDTGAERWLYVVEPGAQRALGSSGTTAATRASIPPTWRAGTGTAAACWSWPISLSATSSSRSIPMRATPSPVALTPPAWDVAGERGAADRAGRGRRTGRLLHGHGPRPLRAPRLPSGRGRSSADARHRRGRRPRARRVARWPRAGVGLVRRPDAAGAARRRGAAPARRSQRVTTSPPPSSSATPGCVRATRPSGTPSTASRCTRESSSRRTRSRPRATRSSSGPSTRTRCATAGAA